MRAIRLFVWGVIGGLVLHLAYGLCFETRGLDLPLNWSSVTSKGRESANSTRSSPASPISPSIEVIDVQPPIVNLVPPPPRQSSGGVISGRVLDESGRPLEGVLVRASPAAESQESDLGRPFPTIDDQLRDWDSRIVAARREGISDSEGQFRIEALEEQGYFVEARIEGWIVQVVEINEYDVMPGSYLEFRARRVEAGTVDVGFPEGTTPKFAQLDVSSLDSDWLEESWLWCSDDPKVRLPPGEYAVTARINLGLAQLQGLHGEWRSQAEKWTVKPAGTKPLLLSLEPCNGVRVRLIPIDGLAMSDLSVGVLRLRPGEEFGDVILDEVNATFYSIASNRTFEFTPLEAGRYAVCVRFGWNEVLAHRIVEVENSVESIELEVPPPSGPSLLLRVEGPGSTPIDDITYVLVKDETSESQAELTRVAPGEFRCWLPSQRGARDVSATNPTFIEVRTEKFGARRVPLFMGQSELKIEFAEPASLDLRVLPANQQVQFLSVEIESTNGVSSSRETTSREISLGPFQPGPYELIIRISNGWNRGEVIHRENFVLPSGRHPHTVFLEPRYTLRVRFDESSWAYLQDEMGSRNVRVRDGVAHFAELPPGAYTIRDDNGRTMTVTIVGDLEVGFEPDR